MKAQSNILRTVWILSVLLTLSLPAYAVDGQIKIGQTPSTTFPIFINQPGSYVLTSNITVSDPDKDGIKITARNVTLDLNGHAITGPGTSGSGHGILVVSGNVAVINGTVSGFGGTGVWNSVNTGQGEGGIVKDIIASGNGGVGILVRGSVVNSIGDSNGAHGISANESSVHSCSATNNNLNGFYLSGSMVTNSTASSNTQNGFWSQHSSIADCTANYNGENGIHAMSRVTVTNCSVTGNGSNGIFGDHGTRIEGNILANNGEYGLMLGAYSYAIKNNALSNTSGNYFGGGGGNNYMPTSLTAPDAANANIGW